MRKKNRKHYHRVGISIPRVFTIAVSVSFIFLSGFTLYHYFHRLSLPFVSVVVASDPVQIIFINKKSGKINYIKLPAASYINTAGRSGFYSLKSTWKLSLLEKNQGDKYKKSLEMAVGIPILYYWGPSAGFADGQYNNGFDICGMSNIRKYLGGELISDIPVFDYLGFCLDKKMTKGSRTENIDIIDKYYFSQTKFPDGSSGFVVNQGKIDELLGSDTEIGLIRTENMSIAVINTTDSDGLSTRISRMLSNIGFRVVSSQSEKRKLAGCEISGTEKSIKTLSADILVSLFNCEKDVRGQDRADLSIFLGKKQADDYSIR